MGASAALERMAARVLDFIDHQGEAPLDGSEEVEATFDALALDVFEFQYANSPIYRAFCDRRKKNPDTVETWREVPAIPTTAFKRLDLACAPAEKTFLTSGTTEGEEARGQHHVPRLELYHRSALSHFRRMVLPDKVHPFLVGFLGSPDQLPNSSLTQMVEWIRQDICDGEGEYLLGQDSFEPQHAITRLEEIAEAGRPLCIIGVRVALTALLEYCASKDRGIELPSDSRIVDTGGPKGGRALSDAGFLNACWHRLGIPGYFCINEYGMTELCSQYYDDVLSERFRGTNEKRRKVGPAWLRPQVVDPDSLEPLPDGESGLLCHFDLANALSVPAVQTEDLGILEGNRFRLLGRAPGSEPRGCALALSDLLAGTP